MSIKELPDRKANREEDCFYFYKGEKVYWDGKRLKCEHKKRKELCKECGGSGICNHNKQRNQCKECKGRNICEHDRIKSQCKECKGSKICEHDMRKERCRECGGNQICEHDKRREICKKCKGNQICEHDKIKSECAICSTNPKNFCQMYKVTDIRGSPYRPLCFRCYCYSHPNENIPRRYKMKQHFIYDKIKELYGDSFEYDKSITGGCSRKRPDFFFDKLTHSVIIEIDEDQHENYSCENKRMMEIFQDLGNRPLVIIRFNPDKYDNVDGCFLFNEKNNISTTDEFDKRMKVLLETIEYHLNNIPKKEITIIKLFFDSEN